MTQPELKPCPFCGGKAELEPIWKGIVGEEEEYWVRCTRSRCGAYGSCRKSAKSAAAAWNRRAGEEGKE